ncbi:MAG: STAS domain-containing protein [Nitrospirota bacterium]|nr:STAS domain-containing protein [Nitrospirota bacterium]
MLQIREKLHHQATVISFAGRFDRQSTIGIGDLILKTKEMRCPHIMLDFTGITAIDSVGLGLLFLWYHRLQPHQIGLSIVGPSPIVRAALEGCHLPDCIPVFDSEHEAVRQEAYC